MIQDRGVGNRDNESWQALLKRLDKTNVQVKGMAEKEERKSPYLARNQEDVTVGGVRGCEEAEMESEEKGGGGTEGEMRDHSTLVL